MAIEKKELVKNIRALNKLKLTGRVKATGALEDMLEDFITAIEKIDDDGKIGKVSDSILDYYEENLPDAGDEGDDDKGSGDGEFDADELYEELEEMSLKEVKAFVKDNDLDVGRITSKTLDEKIDEIVEAMEAKAEDGGDDDGDDDGDEGEDEDLAEKLEDMDLKELRAFIKDNKLKIKGRVTSKTQDDVIEQILDLMEEDGGDDDGEEKDLEDMDVDELLDFAEENDIDLTDRMKNFKAPRLARTIQKKLDAQKKKADTAKDKDKGRDYPKGIRKGTLPAQLYDAIADGATIKELAEPIADEKGKEPSQVYGQVMRTLIRKVAKACTVVLTTDSSGDDGAVTVTLGDD